VADCNYAPDVPDVNAYFCGHCGSKIPTDSIFCPQCGQRTVSPNDVAPGAPQHAPPMPAMAPPAMAARRTPVHMDSVPHAEPGQPYGGAAHGELGAPDGADAYQQGGVGREPRRIAIGSVAVGLAALLAIWIAAGDPADEVLVAGSMTAAMLALAGIGLVLAGAFHRAEQQVRCRRCARPVLARKGAFGLHCPLGPHHARVSWFLVAITAAFWLGLVVTLIGMLVWLAL
jgi:zinc-ribbon domain